jgi:hypothetical protein
LSWNLSKAIRTKDIPHIFNIYLPEHRKSVSEHGMPGIPLHDFDISRKEIIEEVQRTPTRRADNVVSDLIHAGRRLSMHARLCNTISLDYRKIQMKWLGISGALIVLAGVSAWGAFQIWPGWEVGNRSWSHFNSSSGWHLVLGKTSLKDILRKSQRLQNPGSIICRYLSKRTGTSRSNRFECHVVGSQRNRTKNIHHSQAQGHPKFLFHVSIHSKIGRTYWILIFPNFAGRFQRHPPKQKTRS